MTTKAKTYLLLKPGNQWIISLGIIFGLTLAFALPPYMALVVELGKDIHQSDMITDYTTALVWAGVLGISILCWPVRHEDKIHLLWAWLLKCLICLFFLLFYEYYYFSDANGFWSGPKLWKEYLDSMTTERVLGRFYSGTPSMGADRISILVYYYDKLMPNFLSNSFAADNML